MKLSRPKPIGYVHFGSSVLPVIAADVIANGAALHRWITSRRIYYGDAAKALGQPVHTLSEMAAGEWVFNLTEAVFILDQAFPFPLYYEAG